MGQIVDEKQKELDKLISKWYNYVVERSKQKWNKTIQMEVDGMYGQLAWLSATGEVAAKQWGSEEEGDRRAANTCRFAGSGECGHAADDVHGNGVRQRGEVRAATPDDASLTDSKVIGLDFKNKTKKKNIPYGNNAVCGEETTVYAIKNPKDLQRMADWLMLHEDSKYLLGFTLGINLGLRANELLGLRVGDVFNPDGSIRYVEDDVTDTSDKITVYQSKTDKKRRLFLNSACVTALRQLMPDASGRDAHAFLFPSREGGHIEVDTFRKVLKKAAAACGVRCNIGTHSMRKTFGYFHYMKNHDVVFLQRLFGHSSALITMRYIGIAEEEEKASYHSVAIDLLRTDGDAASV